MAATNTEKQISEFLENKIKAKIVVFFLSNSHRAFYNGELEKKLSSRSLGPHLSGLVKNGFLASFVKKGERFFYLNKKNKQLSDWKTAMARKFKSMRKPEDDLLKQLRRIPTLQAAILAGVFMANPQQQCDLILAGELSQRTLDRLVAGIEKEIGQELNYALFDFKDFEYRKHTFDRFMKDIFDNPHFVVLEKSR
jgi:hypothetical protein